MKDERDDARTRRSYFQVSVSAAMQLLSMTVQPESQGPPPWRINCNAALEMLVDEGIVIGVYFAFLLQVAVVEDGVAGDGFGAEDGNDTGGSLFSSERIFEAAVADVAKVVEDVVEFMLAWARHPPVAFISLDFGFAAGVTASFSSWSGNEGLAASCHVDGCSAYITVALIGSVNLPVVTAACPFGLCCVRPSLWRPAATIVADLSSLRQDSSKMDVREMS
ncbi:unnamed protein product [Symbiodinium microadriaticum]|nr:unnamed protein product [Symbiodinium microadriaticum]